MTLYSFRCPACGDQQVQDYPLGSNPSTVLCWCGGQARRDYRADGAMPLVVGLKRDREANGTEGYKEMFLPTAKDYASPADPDGEKGLHNWAEHHEPKPGNKHPAWPTMKRRVF